MKIAVGRVVEGAIVTRAKFPEGARVTVVQHDDRPPVRLSRDEEEEVRSGLREIEDGRALPVEVLKARLQRHRSGK